MAQQGDDKLSQPLYNDCVNMTCSDDDKNILEIHARNSILFYSSKYILTVLIIPHPMMMFLPVRIMVVVIQSSLVTRI